MNWTRDAVDKGPVARQQAAGSSQQETGSTQQASAERRLLVQVFAGFPPRFALFRFPFGWLLAFSILHLASDCWSVVQLHAARAAFLALPPWPPPLTQLLPGQPETRADTGGCGDGSGRQTRLGGQMKNHSAVPATQLS
ncbi:hypothetical protein AWZ03_008660 [Drosophila navojoa]|uniref:Uncharacterized protein n=1 Tax=Drosophila navojoa TaxID=7232 RepID=A0A484B8G3_DRONA|nr:hypothetical protein AWZ03_008660 [Drosophila navojoa]